MDINYKALPENLRKAYENNVLNGNPDETYNEFIESENKINDQTKKDEIETKIKQFINQIGKRFKNCTLENYEVKNDKQQKVVDYIKNYLQSDLFKNRSIIMIGDTGTGKNHLTSVIVQNYIKCGGSAFFIELDEIFQKVKETYKRDSNQTENQVLNKYYSEDLLVIDEVGVSHGTDAELRIITKIINKRYANYKNTIMISNLKNKAALVEYLGVRAFSRILGTFDVLSFEWEDYRVK